MKYNKFNPPLKCTMTHSTCYQNTSKMEIKGVLIHSTGANNPFLKRYVQPSPEDPNYQDLMNKLGVNELKNDWNHIDIQAGLNAWIGMLNNQEITTIQTMPWDYKPWGCGSSVYGSCNNGWIQFEICEGNLIDKNYFEKVYQEACELIAYLCQEFSLDPRGFVNYAGQSVPVILCHQDSYKLGLGSNHEDVYHWFNKYGKTMQHVRNDVAKLLGLPSQELPTETPILTRILRKNCEGDDVMILQQKLLDLGYNLGLYGVDGDFGEDTEIAVLQFQ